VTPQSLAALAVITIALLVLWTGLRRRRPQVRPRPGARPRPYTRRASLVGSAYPGDFTGRADISYSPHLDGRPDPGEVVWTWVPFEDDARKGKDRPVLLIGRDGRWLLGLMLTSKGHDHDAAKEAHFGRYWQDIGTGGWDHQRRPSEVRLDRIIRIDPRAVRREGAILDRDRFADVTRSLSAVHRW